MLWNGFASAAAGVGAGLLAFVILLFFKKRKPALIVEGFLFGGLTAAGELIEYPGGTILLTELVFSLILLLSVLAGKDIVSRMTGDFGKGLFSATQSRVVSITLGSVFFFHSVLCSVLALFGCTSPWIYGILFVLVYVLASKSAKKQMKSAAQSDLPVLVANGDGFFTLERENRPLGGVRLISESGRAALLEITSLDSEPHDFLSQLQVALRRRGIKSFTISSWSFDEIELEMAGFINSEGKWKKMI